MNEPTQGFLVGKKVKLVAPNEEQDAVTLSNWTRDSEYWRLCLAEPARFRYPAGQIKWIKEAKQNGYLFMIKTQPQDVIIGQIEISEINRTSANGWLSISIGDREYWGKKYGVEAIQLMMDFGFTTLNLHRISLTVFSYNGRAIKAYQKVGFKMEGSEKEALWRDGKRWDIIYMGILKGEWQDIIKVRNNL